jgi:hypothetical protein
VTGRTQTILFGPIVALLPVHILLLVLAARTMPAHGPWRLGDPWTTWNLAAPVLLLFVFGYVTRRTIEGSAPLSLTRWTWGAAIADLLLTAVAFVLTLPH